MTLDVANLSSTTNGAGSPANILSTLRGLAKDDAGADDRATVTKADLSIPFIRSTTEEDTLIASIRDAALAAGNHSVACADRFWLLACARARKGDIPRALALADNYCKWRASIDSEGVNVATSDKMRSQLERRIVFVAGNTDRDGRPVINLRLRNQDPRTFAAIDTTRMISFVLEWTLRTYPAAQTHGLVIVNDLTGVSFKNLDIRLPGVLQKAFSRNVPARVASFNIINPSGFFKAVFSILAPILSFKMKARMRVFSQNSEDKERFAEFFASDQTMRDTNMGGTAEWTDEMHQEWVERMVNDCQTWAPFTANKEDISS